MRNNEIIMSNLKWARTRLNMSQKELANESGIAKTQISNYERGEREPTIANIIKLCKALKVSIDFMVGINNKVR